jgi:hypothetical protein
VHCDDVMRSTLRVSNIGSAPRRPSSTWCRRLGSQWLRGWVLAFVAADSISCV